MQTPTYDEFVEFVKAQPDDAELDVTGWESGLFAQLLRSRGAEDPWVAEYAYWEDSLNSPGDDEDRIENPGWLTEYIGRMLVEVRGVGRETRTKSEVLAILDLCKPL